MTDFLHLLLDSYKILLANIKTFENYSGFNFYLKKGNHTFEMFPGSVNNYVLTIRGGSNAQEISLSNTYLDQLFKDYEAFVANEFGIPNSKAFQKQAVYSLNKNAVDREIMFENLLGKVLFLKDYGISFSNRVKANLNSLTFEEGNFRLYSNSCNITHPAEYLSSLGIS